MDHSALLDQLTHRRMCTKSGRSRVKKATQTTRKYVFMSAIFVDDLSSKKSVKISRDTDGEQTIT